MSATANFVGALTGTAVAMTIAAGSPTRRRAPRARSIVAAALVGAIVWNLITWRLGIPSSSSHALIGGLLGAVDRRRGRRRGHLVDGVVDKVLVPLVLSPVLGIVIGVPLHGRAAERVPAGAARGGSTTDSGGCRSLSAAFMAFSHGSNDAQKTMGIMTLALFTAGVIPTVEVPLWVILLSATAISLGTAAGGWRIIKTMGQKVVKLDPVHGFAAETTAATIILDRVALRDAGVDDPRHLERDHGRRLEHPAVGRPLGRRRQHRDRLGPDDPRVGARGGSPTSS